MFANTAILIPLGHSKHYTDEYENITQRLRNRGSGNNYHQEWTDTKAQMICLHSMRKLHSTSIHPLSVAMIGYCSSPPQCQQQQQDIVLRQEDEEYEEGDQNKKQLEHINLATSSEISL